ncbi:hypothetical protein SAMN05444172_7088 [Burkholderia sp. GAS332]|jgi:hypothetical protein|nr:hypothetical protein SAMN05444172_7088 [Burkholderia sp. GAS332]
MIRLVDRRPLPTFADAISATGCSVRRRPWDSARQTVGEATGGSGGDLREKNAIAGRSIAK